jgi:hypothetical protein
MILVRQLFRKYRLIILYAALIAVLIFVLKWLHWKYLIADYSIDVYAGLLAIFFTLLGIWIALQLAKKKTSDCY